MGIPSKKPDTSSLFVVGLLLSEFYSNMLSFSKEVSTAISLTQVLIWIIIAAVVGVVGELIARRRAPDGIIGAVILGFLAIFIVVGLFHFHIAGEPFLGGVPIISSIIAALIGVWLLTKVIIISGIGDVNVHGVPIFRALVSAIILVAIWQLLAFGLSRGRSRNA
jgi:uncharacterized membrane protein YeaQ/YmgE (transglycosylase-associated protein family)